MGTLSSGAASTMVPNKGCCDKRMKLTFGSFSSSADERSISKWNFKIRQQSRPDTLYPPRPRKHVRPKSGTPQGHLGVASTVMLSIGLVRAGKNVQLGLGLVQTRQKSSSQRGQRRQVRWVRALSDEKEKSTHPPGFAKLYVGASSAASEHELDPRMDHLHDLGPGPLLKSSDKNASASHRDWRGALRVIEAVLPICGISLFLGS